MGKVIVSQYCQGPRSTQSAIIELVFRPFASSADMICPFGPYEYAMFQCLLENVFTYVARLPESPLVEARPAAVQIAATIRPDARGGRSSRGSLGRGRGREPSPRNLDARRVVRIDQDLR